jgi:hypothetical protein
MGRGANRDIGNRGRHPGALTPHEVGGTLRGMRIIGALLALFGGGGVVSGILRYLEGRHVEPIGIGLLAILFVGGLLLVFLGSARARATSHLGAELAVLKVAERHAGRVTAVLVAAETKLPIAVAARELAALVERGACVRRTDEGDTPWFLFPELESEEVKRKLFFTDAQASRARRGQPVGS